MLKDLLGIYVLHGLNYKINLCREQEGKVKGPGVENLVKKGWFTRSDP